MALLMVLQLHLLPVARSMAARLPGAAGRRCCNAAAGCCEPGSASTEQALLSEHEALALALALSLSETSPSSALVLSISCYGCCVSVHQNIPGFISDSVD